MLNYKSLIIEDKKYSGLSIKEISPIKKLNLRGKSRDFLSTIGKRSLYRTDTIREDRKQMVGLLTDNPNTVLEEGAQIVSELNQIPIKMLGHVTSSYFSPNLKKSIALAVVKGGKAMMGKKLFIPMENKTINVTVVDPVFLDKENKRLNA